jgi:hypothetical protein
MDEQKEPRPFPLVAPSDTPLVRMVLRSIKSHQALANVGLDRIRYIAYNLDGDISKVGIYPCGKRRYIRCLGDLLIKDKAAIGKGETHTGRSMSGATAHVPLGNAYGASFLDRASFPLVQKVPLVAKDIASLGEAM